MHLRVFAKERREEPEAYDVVHVEVGEEDVDPPAVAVEFLAKAADAGACIENEERAVVRADFDAGRVAAVAHSFRAGVGERTARAPQLDLHGSFQMRATAPSSRPPWPSIGKAVISASCQTPSSAR